MPGGGYHHAHFTRGETEAEVSLQPIWQILGAELWILLPQKFFNLTWVPCLPPSRCDTPEVPFKEHTRGLCAAPCSTPVRAGLLCCWADTFVQAHSSDLKAALGDAETQAAWLGTWRTRSPPPVGERTGAPRP